MRAMWLHHPGDQHAAGLGTQYLWWRDLLVAPVVTKGAASRDVYLPQGLWYDWWTNAPETGGRTVTRAVDLATMPIYVRAGAIIPVDPVRQFTGQHVEGPTTLRIYRGQDGQFTLYDDDGVSQAYLEGRGAWIRMTWHDAARRLTIPAAGRRAQYRIGPRISGRRAPGRNNARRRVQRYAGPGGVRLT
jgi:alpha-glucosidase/alpha-D-xyloside xylohydrolase